MHELQFIVATSGVQTPPVTVWTVSLPPLCGFELTQQLVCCTLLCQNLLCAYLYDQVYVIKAA